MSRVLKDLEEFLQAQGLEKASPEFQKAYLKEKVYKCMDLHDVQSCTDCPLFLDCSLRLAYWRSRTLGTEYTDYVEDPLGETEEDSED